MTRTADSAARRHRPPASSFHRIVHARVAPRSVHMCAACEGVRREEYELKNENNTVPDQNEDSGFAALGISGVLLKATEQAGLTEPKPIQIAAIPPHLAARDVLGVAQTGSGKTAAFALPILSKIIGLGSRRKPRTARALVLAPTRELAVQIEETFRLLSKGAHVSTALVLGGVSRNTQVKRLQPGVDVLVATPGRLMDLVRERDVDLSETTWLVLDEADRMLDMGFLPDVRRIAKATHPARQTAMFSATMPTEIEELARTLLRDPVRVEAAPQGTTAGEISQSIVLARLKQKRKLLSDMLANPAMSRVIVFARTKHGADRVTRDLGRDGHEAAVIHGNKSQNARQKALNGFRDGTVRILVATDIAARGIDIDGITHIINYDLPNEPESYVHRIGRTARAGADGVALSFCGHDELAYLKDIEKTTRQKIAIDGDHPFHAERIATDHANGKTPPPPRQGGRPQRPQRSGKPSGAGRPGGGQRNGRSRSGAGRARAMA
ncbi:MAG: DEAD/DEAH box helicase [Rhizobiaceae bacterium]|nr:DEAD/DEAH box helicase [Rhizobiaceae bacterium]